MQLQCVCHDTLPWLISVSLGLMSRVPIQIGPRLFSSKSEAKSFTRELISRYGDGETISGVDDTFLRDLIAIHHDAAKKIGCGIAHFTVQPDPNWGTTRHFVIVR